MFKKIIVIIALMTLGTTIQIYAKSPSAYRGPMSISKAHKCERNQNLAAQKEPFKKGDLVFVEWHKKWFKASVLKVNNTKKNYYINYDSWSHSWNEWVGLNRIIHRTCG
jgi:hypothetical protein